MKYRDISIRKKILLSNFLMVLIPIIFVCLILFSLLLGFSFLTNSPSAMIRNVLLNSSNYGPTLLIKSMSDELASSTTINEEALAIFQQMEAINLHIQVETDGKLLYRSPDVNAEQLDQEYHTIASSEAHEAPYIIWNQKGMAYRSALRNDAGELLDIRFTGVGLRLPKDSYASWEHTKLLIKIGIIGTGTCMVLLIVLLGVLLTKKLSTHILLPLRELQEATTEIKEGNLYAPIHAKAADELGEVCENFEAMRLQLIASQELQKHYEQNRKELIAGISHDLSTPLTSIQGYVNGLLDGIANTPEKQKHYLQIIQDKTRSMNDLVDSLFLFSKLDLNQEPFHDELVDLRHYMQDWYEERKDSYQDMKLYLTFTSYIKEPMKLFMDRKHFIRVLDNLCQNSIKYKKADIVHMDVCLYKEGTDCVLTLQDDGSGIAKDEAERLFDSFYRGDPARSSKIKGNGLGLSISKQIIEHMGGQIEADGDKGKGLCITIRLPQRQGGIS